MGIGDILFDIFKEINKTTYKTTFLECLLV